MADKSVAVQLRLNAQQYRASLASAATATKGFGRDAAQVAGQMRQDFTSVAFSISSMAGIAAGLKFGRDLIDDASRLEQAVGGTEAVFKAASGEIDAFAESAAESVGLSKAAARELTTGLGASLTQVGVEAGEAAAKSIELTEAGADLAATFGGTTEDAVAAMGAAFRGEFDSLERFGVTLRQSEVDAKAVSLGLAESASSVDANARATATLALIQERAAAFSGQFARESDTAAVAQQRARAEMENTRAELGQNLLPLYTEAMEILGGWAGVLGSLPQPIQQVVVALAALVAFQGPIRGVAAAMGTLRTSIAATQIATFTSGAIAARPALVALGSAARAAGIAAVGGAIAFQQWNSMIDEAKRKGAEFAAQIEQMTLGQDASAVTAERLRNQYAELAAGINGVISDYNGSDAPWDADKRAQQQQWIEDNLATHASLEDVILAFEGLADAAGISEDEAAAFILEQQQLTGEVLTGEAALEAYNTAMEQAAIETEAAGSAMTNAQKHAEALAGSVDGVTEAIDAQRATWAKDDALAGIGDAAAEMAQANQELVDAANEATAGVRTARRDLVDVERDAAQAVIDAQEEARQAVEEAQQAVVDAHEQAADDIADAQEKVADAVRARADAEEEAVERVRDAQKELRRAEEDSAREIREAREALAKATADNADWKEIKRLRDRLEDIERRHARALEDAKDDVSDAERDKAKSIEDADDRVTDAQEALTEAMLTAAERIMNAEADQAAAVEDAGARIMDAEAARSDAVEGARDRVNQAIAAQVAAAANLSTNWQTAGDQMRATEAEKLDAIEALVAYMTAKYGPAWAGSAVAMAEFQAALGQIHVPPGLQAVVDAITLIGATGSSSNAVDFMNFINAVTGAASGAAGKTPAAPIPGKTKTKSFESFVTAGSITPAAETAAAGAGTTVNQHFKFEGGLSTQTAIEQGVRRGSMMLESVF